MLTPENLESIFAISLVSFFCFIGIVVVAQELLNIHPKIKEWVYNVVAAIIITATICSKDFPSSENMFFYLIMFVLVILLIVSGIKSTKKL